MDSSVATLDASSHGALEAPPLSWPPPGLEPIQGRMWRVITLLAAGGVLMGAPLLWAFAVPQPFWSLGPFEGSWQIGLALTLLGLTVLLVGFSALVQLLRQAARAADAGYGSATVWEAATDLGRDTGFLIQGRRHFAAFDRTRREGLVRARLRGAFFILAAALWLPSGLALALLLAARGWLGPTGIWILSLGPTALLLVPGILLALSQALRVASARRRWEVGAGGEAHVREEGRGWRARLAATGSEVALGGGPAVAGRSLRRAALGAAVLFALVLAPVVTLALTAAVGPILADTAVPTFLSVQEMAGAAEALRGYELEEDPSITPQQAGDALQNLVFVGPNQRPEPMERAPRMSYPGAGSTTRTSSPTPSRRPSRGT